jgi:hypothetical protein
VLEAFTLPARSDPRDGRDWHRQSASDCQYDQLALVFGAAGCKRQAGPICSCSLPENALELTASACCRGSRRRPVNSCQCDGGHSVPRRRRGRRLFPVAPFRAAAVHPFHSGQVAQVKAYISPAIEPPAPLRSASRFALCLDAVPVPFAIRLRPNLLRHTIELRVSRLCARSAIEHRPVCRAARLHRAGRPVWLRQDWSKQMSVLCRSDRESGSAGTCIAGR